MLESMGIIRAVFARTWVKVFRRPIVLAFALVQPLMWMLFFGFLFHRYELKGLPENISYLEFLLPGVCVMTVLFGASQSGVSLIRDMQTGIWERMLMTPAGAGKILAGKLLADISRFLAQAFVIALAGWILGAAFRIRLGPLILGTLYLGLFAAAYSCLSCYIALKTRSQETLGAFIHVFNMPLLFTSSVLVPARHMPEWLGGVAAWNPLSMVADMLRGALLFGRMEGEAERAVVLGALAILLFYAAMAATGMNLAAQRGLSANRPVPPPDGRSPQ